MLLLLAAFSKQKLKVLNKNPQICLCAGIKRKDFYNFSNAVWGLGWPTAQDGRWVGTEGIGPKQGSEGQMDLGL